jgi:hypothetical protein
MYIRSEQMDLYSVWWLVGFFVLGTYSGVLIMALMAMSGKEGKRANADRGMLSGLSRLDGTTLSP